MARVIAICNQKGGVGKTTTAMNLGAYLAALGRRCLLIDFDPQANATSGLGIASPQESIYNALMNDLIPGQLIKRTAIFGYEVLPAAPDLAGALVELISLPEREYRLRKVVNQVRHLYDFILIDLPPSLNLLTINGLVAADEILVPIQCEYYSLEGIGHLLKTIELIRQNLGYKLKVAGAILTMYNKKEKLSREVANEVRKHFPHNVFNVEIPRAVALAEAPSFGKPIILYAPYNPAARAYLLLAKEIIGQQEQEIKIQFANQVFGNLLT
jgi:chromosome partitioning protein